MLCAVVWMCAVPAAVMALYACMHVLPLVMPWMQGDKDDRQGCGAMGCLGKGPRECLWESGFGGMVAWYGGGVGGPE